MPCATCKRTFLLKGKSKAKTSGYRRHSLSSCISTGTTIGEAITNLYDLQIHVHTSHTIDNDDFVCSACHYRIKKWHELRCRMEAAEAELYRFCNTTTTSSPRKRKLPPVIPSTPKRRVCISICTKFLSHTRVAHYFYAPHMIS